MYVHTYARIFLREGQKEHFAPGPDLGFNDKLLLSQYLHS